jgi:hypothetical protein
MSYVPVAVLLGHQKVGATVLTPGFFVAFANFGLGLTVADGFHVLRLYTELNKVLLNPGSATLAQCQVVLFGTAFVTVTLDEYVQTFVKLDDLSVTLKCGSGIVSEVGFVELKVDVIHGVFFQLKVGEGIGLLNGLDHGRRFGFDFFSRFFDLGYLRGFHGNGNIGILGGTCK